MPGDEDWKKLEIYLGMLKADADQTGWRGTDQGVQLKSTSGWGSGSGTNTSGFTALPGGYRAFNDAYIHLGSDGYWWTLTEENDKMAYARIISTAHPTIHRSFVDKASAYSVRCIKN